MPEPGKTMTPIGRTSRIWSLRLKGAALAWRVQSGLNGICVHLAGVGPAGGDALGAGRRAAVQQDHVGMLGVDLVERAPDQLMVVEVEHRR